MVVDTIGGANNGGVQMEYWVGRGANGGSNFIDNSYFTEDIKDESGVNNGNGYIIITKI